MTDVDPATAEIFAATPDPLAPDFDASAALLWAEAVGPAVTATGA